MGRRIVHRVWLVIGLLAALFCLADERGEAGAPNAARAEKTSFSLPPRQEDAKQWFLERYAEASARLSADPSPLHGTVRYRQYRKAEPGPWRTIDFFVDGGRVRVRREYATLNGVWEGRPPDTMLLTPDAAATVVDPGTEFAWATYLSDKPNGSFSHQIWVHSWRLLRASYCIGRKSLGEHLASGNLIVESVEFDSTNDGLLHLRCRPLVDLLKDKSGPTMARSLDIWLDANQDFVIRKSRSVYGEPHPYEFATEAGSYAPLPNGGWVPNAYFESVYAAGETRAAPAEQTNEAGALLQRVEYEVLRPIETREMPDSYFTLESLGVYPANRHLELWLLTAASAAVLLIVLLARRSARQRRFPAAHGDELPT